MKQKPSRNKRKESEKEKKKHFKFFWLNIILGAVLVILLLAILVYLAPETESSVPYYPHEDKHKIDKHIHEKTGSITYYLNYNSNLHLYHQGFSPLRILTS